MSGDYIAKAFGKKMRVDLKKDLSPVTETDRNVEIMIREAVSKKFPSHGIVGEEFGTENPGAEFQWVIDPIDGTKSFISGVPLFGTLIGLRYRGEPVLGLINQPVLRERIVGDCRTCLFNGVQTKPLQKTDAKSITLLTSDSRHCRTMHSAAGWAALENSAAISRTWGDCYGYMLVCRGLAHVMCDAVLEIWDLSAIIPALKGCGAAFSDWSGGTDIGPNGLVASCTERLHGEVIEILNPPES